MKQLKEMPEEKIPAGPSYRYWFTPPEFVTLKVSDIAELVPAANWKSQPSSFATVRLPAAAVFGTNSPRVSLRLLAEVLPAHVSASEGFIRLPAAKLARVYTMVENREEIARPPEPEPVLPEDQAEVVPEPEKPTVVPPPEKDIVPEPPKVVEPAPVVAKVEPPVAQPEVPQKADAPEKIAETVPPEAVQVVEAEKPVEVLPAPEPEKPKRAFSLAGLFRRREPERVPEAERAPEATPTPKEVLPVEPRVEVVEPLPEPPAQPAVVLEAAVVEPAPADPAPPPVTVTPVVESEPAGEPELEVHSAPVESVPELRVMGSSASETSAREIPDQEPLQGLFLTEEILTVPRVIELCGGLPGINSCVLTHGTVVVASHNVPAGVDLVSMSAHASDMLQAMRASSARMGVGSVPAVTLHTEKGVISFFNRDDLTMLVFHRDRGFVPGVREKMASVLGELSKARLTLPVGSE